MPLFSTINVAILYNFCTKTLLIFKKEAIFQLFYDEYLKILYIILCIGYIIYFLITKHNLAFCNFSIIFFRSNILFVENFGTSLSEKSTISTKLSTMFFDLPAISYLSNLQNKLSLLSDYNKN